MSKFLVIQLSRLGDLVQSLPLPARFKQEYPGCSTTLLCAEEFREILHGASYVDRIVTLRTADIIPLDTKDIVVLDDAREALLDRLLQTPELREEYDLAVNLTHNLAGSLICHRVRAARKTGRVDDGKGYSEVLGPWGKYLFAIAADRRHNLFNIADIYMGMGEVSHKPLEGFLRVSSTDKERALSILNGHGRNNGKLLLGFHIGTSNPMRRWPTAGFASVAGRLARRGGVQMVLLGGSGEREIGDEFIRLAHIPVIDLIGATRLADLPAIISQCDFIISNDTGPIHVAAAVGTRTLGLYFSSGHFAETAPYQDAATVIQAELPCCPCHEGETCERGADCRNVITESIVAEAAEMALWDEMPREPGSPGSPPASSEYPEVSVYKSLFLANGTIFYAPVSGRVSEQYQTGFVNRIMWEAAMGMRDGGASVRDIPGLLDRGEPFDRKVRGFRDALSLLAPRYRSAIRSIHEFTRAADAGIGGTALPSALNEELRNLEDHVRNSPALIQRNLHILEMAAMDSVPPQNLLSRLLLKYSRLCRMAESSLAALESFGPASDPEPGVAETAPAPIHDRAETLYLALSSGENFGWGICGKYLRKELSRRMKVISLDQDTALAASRTLPGRVLHTIAAADFRSLFPARGTHNFGYTFFENELSPLSLRNAREYDVVIAGSSWCRDRLTEKGIPGTRVLIQGIDPEIFHPVPEKRDDRAFVIFSGGKFELRKGQDLVLKAVAILQQKYNDIILVNAWYNKWPASMELMALSPHIRYAFRGDTWEEAMSYLYAINGLEARRIATYPIVPNWELRSLYAQTDLGVFPNRCEGGTNLVLMEYMACGRPVVASRASGHKDILTENNSIMLKDLRSFRLHDKAGNLTADWEEPSLDELVAAVEYAYHHREEIRKIGGRAGEDLREHTWSRMADKVLEIVYG